MSFLRRSNLIGNTDKPKDEPLQQILDNSQEFSEKFPNALPNGFPVTSVLCESLLRSHPHFTREILERHANSAYPLLHESALKLYADFLTFKKKYGSEVEKTLYKNMSVIQLIQRVLEKRALYFCGKDDNYVLWSGVSGVGGWETVGTDQEIHPLVLANCLSYDEMKLSALLSVTSYSVFINDGNRRNCGRPSYCNSFQRHGVVMGIIGSRLSEGPIMEFQEMVITTEQNIQSKGYGGNGNCTDTPIEKWRQIWADFYGVPNLPMYEDVEILETSSRFLKLKEGMFFDNEIYSKRISIAAETILLEAEARAASENKKAYIHVVGIGLGKWMISLHQEKLFLDTFAECLRSLQLPHVSDVNFAWFKRNSCGNVKNGGTIENSGNDIKIHFTNRSPHTKLDDDAKLLMVIYPWNVNSLPGNDFWTGKLESSGDPANACSTQVSELQNPYINRKKICGTNLHIASRQCGITHVSEFIKHKNIFR